jgi:hypothetical protein
VARDRPSGRRFAFQRLPDQPNPVRRVPKEFPQGYAKRNSLFYRGTRLNNLGVQLRPQSDRDYLRKTQKRVPRDNVARSASGAPGRIRTCGQDIRRVLLYPLSYGGGPESL